MPAHLHLAPSPSEEPLRPSAASPVRVVLADDHELIRHSLGQLLEAEQDIELVAVAEDLISALRQVETHRPHVLVLDLRMPDGSSVEAVRMLRRRAPGTAVVMLTMEDSPTLARHVLAAGTLGFVSKDLADAELAQAIRAVARGEEYVSPRVAPRLDALRRALAHSARAEAAQ